jgi:hypothetical protein
MIKDKDWLRAFFTTESEYAPLEFIQAFIYLMLYFFCFGYYTNLLFALLRLEESDQPIYMARLHGFYGILRNRSKPLKLSIFGFEREFTNWKVRRIDGTVMFNQLLTLCGLIVTTRFFGLHDLPNLFIFTIAFLLIIWSMILANIYACEDLECKFSTGAKEE